MKKNLGKIILLLIVLHVNILAQQLLSYELSANKTDAFIKEAIEITFKARQKDHSHIMAFFLKPIESTDYKIIFLTKVTKDKKHHDSSAIFKYILFPLKAKTINVNFDLSVKVSNDESLAQAYVTDHDESSGIEGVISHIEIKPLHLNIKPLAQKVDLVGDFHLESSIDTNSIKSYENVNLHYILKGTGYNNSLNILKPIQDVSLFKDVSSRAKKLTIDGYKINRDYVYALSSKSDFKVPHIHLKVYSPSQHRFYMLQTPDYHIHVTKIDPKTLLDKQESPQKGTIVTYNRLKKWSIYLFIFLSGFSLAKLMEMNLSTKKSKKFQDIQKSITPQELILILLNNYKDRDINRWIKQLEVVAYGKKEKSFNSIKKELLKELK